MDSNGGIHHHRINNKKKKRPRTDDAGAPAAAAAASPPSTATAAHKQPHHHKYHKHHKHHKHGNGGAAFSPKREQGQRSVFKQHVEARRSLPIWNHRERIVEVRQVLLQVLASELALEPRTSAIDSSPSPFPPAHARTPGHPHTPEHDPGGRDGQRQVHASAAVPGGGWLLQGGSFSDPTGAAAARGDCLHAAAAGGGHDGGGARGGGDGHATGAYVVSSFFPIRMDAVRVYLTCPSIRIHTQTNRARRWATPCASTTGRASGRR